MSITWGGSIRVDGSARTRVGISVSTSSVGHNSSKVTATVTYYLGQKYHENRQMTLDMGGSISGTHSFQNNYGTNGDGSYHTIKLATRTYTYTYGSNEYGSSPGSRTFNAYIATGLGSTPTVSVRWRIPARPIARPAAPTGNTAEWVTFGQTTRQSWTRHSTAAAPYRKVQVQWGLFLGPDGWLGYVGGIVNLSSGATHYNRSATGTNRAYRYRVRAGNDAGWSDWAYFPAGVRLFTTPAAPSRVHGKTNSAGDKILLSWQANSYTIGSTTQEVQRRVNGGSWSTVKTGLSASAQSWTDGSPGAGTNEYRIRVKHAKESLDSSDIYSSWAPSNVISTIVAPLAPTGLNPDGETFDLSEDLTLAWVHHDGGDGVDQTHRKVEYSSNGGQTWSPLLSDDASDEQSWVLPGGTLANGATYQWRVATEGVVSEGYGPWSDAATVTGSARPVVSITAPSGTITTGHVAASWTYSQEQSSPQADAHVLLLDVDDNILEARTVLGDGTSLTFDTYCHDGDTYTVRVNATSADGVVSHTDVSTFTVNVPNPATVTTDIEYQHLTGTMLMHLEADTPQSGEAQTISVRIERTLDGREWVTLTDELALPADFVDPLPSTFGWTMYRVTSISAEPGYRTNDLIKVFAPGGEIATGLPDQIPVEVGGANTSRAWTLPSRQWVFVSFGPAFSQVLRVRSNPQVSSTSPSVASVAPRLGRALPRARFGINRGRKVDVQASLIHAMPGDQGAGYFEWDSPQHEWEALAGAGEVVCLRDFTGRRVFGVLDGDVSFDYVGPRRTDMSFSVVEVDYTEEYD